VLFAGIMKFIYAGLVVPPLVAINARYYGWRAALYIAAILFVNIVVTALAMHFIFAALGIVPESRLQDEGEGIGGAAAGANRRVRPYRSAAGSA
jgi:hypothetical protein